LFFAVHDPSNNIFIKNQDKKYYYLYCEWHLGRKDIITEIYEKNVHRVKEYTIECNCRLCKKKDFDTSIFV
jgi:hypothetical protein